MKNKRNIRVVIPAAGKGVRSGLSYPKCLYRINKEPILISILKKMQIYDERPIIIINPKEQIVFKDIMREYGFSPEFAFQEIATGMGAAVLCADKFLSEEDSILLVWSDIPFLNGHTISSLVNCHFCAANDLSFVSSVGNNCYTIVNRERGKVVSLLETKVLKIPPLPYGERDIGLFIFSKKPVFDILRREKDGAFENNKNEHGFLDIIEKLVMQNYRVEAYPIAFPDDTLSFNSPEDLKRFTNVPSGSCH